MRTSTSTLTLTMMSPIAMITTSLCGRLRRGSVRCITSVSCSSADGHVDPWDILRELPINDGKGKDGLQIPLPTKLSPTSLETFKKCPQNFFFKYILKMKTETTPALARGIFCHSALEEVFDLSAEDRTLDNLQNLFRREWGRHRRVDPDDSAYSVLFRDDGGEYNLDEEIEWGTASVDLLKNYYRLEDPSSVPDPNPLMREMWCHGSTALDDDTTVTVRGKIDRLDVDVSDKIRMSIIDYKTGKKPNFKYSVATNERIANEQFFKMRVYLWMLTKMMENTDGRPTLPGDDEEGQRKFRLPWILSERIEESLGRKVRWTDEVELTNLRLMFLTSHVGDRAVEGEPGAATYLDYPIRGRDEEFAAIDEEIRSLVGDIKRLVDLNDTCAFEHCDWSYCSCHQLRAGFEPSKVHWTEEARELLG